MIPFEDVEHKTGTFGALIRLLPLVAGVALAVGWAASTPVVLQGPPRAVPADASMADAVAALNSAVDRLAVGKGLHVARPAPDLTVLRRITLAFFGTVPSLQEVRGFEADRAPQRLERWVDRFLEDRRFGDYFAERLATFVVGTDDNQFLLFRRDRFREWLSSRLMANTPYDQVVRELVSQQGLWTGKPAANFVTAAVGDDDLDEMKLAGRTVRSFLGQRMDCAQCHDHPFADWTQAQFQGLAAFYGQTGITLAGVEDDPEKELEIREDGMPVMKDDGAVKKKVVPPTVPFHPEWLPATGTRRQKLGEWLTHRNNRRFARAVSNRVWGYLFGRPFHQPVDDLPDPPVGESDQVLDIVARDFARHGYDFRRLLRVLTRSKVFRADSSVPQVLEADELEKHEKAWAVFPLVRLRPEQIVGSFQQTFTMRTVNQNAPLIMRFIRLVQENEFIQRFGDLGDDELREGGGTIPQRLMLLNGKLPNELAEASPISAAGRISGMAPTDEVCVETAYLVCLTRRPEPAERDYFVGRLAGKTGDDRSAVMHDLFWTLFNTTEFSWNH